MARDAGLLPNRETGQMEEHTGGWGEEAAKIALQLVLVLSICTVAARAEHAKVTLTELQERTQQLWDAVAPGDRDPWKRWIADDAMVFDESGHDMDKEAVLAGITKLPDGYSGSIEIVDMKARFAWETIITSYNANETETVYGTMLHARYHMTDTWLYRKSKWQIAGSQVLRYYEDP